MKTLLFIASIVGFAATSPSEHPWFDAEGYSLAHPERQLEFPRDHGSHPDFKTEWWYITGHLENAEAGKAYGFQLTFYRSARAAPDDDKPIEATDQLYLAHAALLDKSDGDFRHEERLNSGHWNADAAVGALDVYNGNWYLRMTDPDTESMQARFSIAGHATISLDLLPLKPRTLFGEVGYSQKGADPGAASHYITFTRLQVEAEATIDGQDLRLDGVAWMDHEYSSSQLSDGQIGWDWTSLILDDGSELMAYVMRREDGAVDPYSRLAFIDPDGHKTEWPGGQFQWTPTRHWTSPETGARYPVEYEIAWTHTDGEARRIHVRPYADAQEMRGKIGSFTYWEGASQAFDPTGRSIGRGYTELTGYDQSLRGRF